MVSTKQIILISSLMSYLFIISLVFLNEYLFSFPFPTFYSGIGVSVLIFHAMRSGLKTATTASLLTDLINIKVSILLVSIPYTLFWLIVFSSSPTTMFSNKFFSITFLINQSVSLSFNLTFFSQSLYTVCYLRTILYMVRGLDARCCHRIIKITMDRACNGFY